MEVKVELVVEERLVRALPALRPLLGRNVQLVAVEADRETELERISFDTYLLRRRLSRPSGVAPVSLEDMDQAIAEGAAGAA